MGEGPIAVVGGKRKLPTVEDVMAALERLVDERCAIAAAGLAALLLRHRNKEQSIVSVSLCIPLRALRLTLFKN